MKTFVIFKIFLIAIISVIFYGEALAQETQDVKAHEAPLSNANQSLDIRQNVLLQLGLTREQVQQIRRLNQERKPLMEAAQRRFREANLALDIAIYSDQTSDADVEARLSEVQIAQAEVVKLRFASEYAVRKILTSEQLIRFRDLRQKFEKIRRDMEIRRTVDRTPNNDQPTNFRPARRYLKQQLQKPI